jgi:DNA processing protein
MKELKYWVAFNNIEGLGAISIKRIQEYFNSMKEAWSASPAELQRVEGLSPSHIEKILLSRAKIIPDKELEKIEKNDIKVLCLASGEYPALLKEIYDPPAVLYYRGNIKTIDFQKTTGIVGTRKPSEYGKNISSRISKELASLGITIVSGLAEGIDTAAHAACVKAKGKTIAVLGSGLNVIYPRSNVSLYKQIIENDCGIIISEYPPDSKPDSWQFPYRNRIISGLSKAIILVETKNRGGGLITARHAIEQNREVFVVPSRVDIPCNEGGHNLVRKGEARLFASFADFYRELNWEKYAETFDEKPPETAIEKESLSPAQGVRQEEAITPVADPEKLSTEKIFKMPDGLSENEKQILALLEVETLAFDIILQKVKSTTPQLLGSLTMLELKGLITQCPGKRYKRNIV